MSGKSIHEACCGGDIDRVRELIAKDPSCVDADDQHKWRPVFHAGLWKQEEIVRLLIDSGADLAAHDGYVMHYAGEVPGNKVIVELLIRNGALDAHVRPTSDLSRQFLSAVFMADAKRVKSLLALHPDLAGTIDGRGDQPIHHASRNGDTEIVQLLIDAGADVNAVTSRGHTTLYCAGGHGHLETFELLLKHGADPTARLSDGKTLWEWLQQYPDDTRFQTISKAIRKHDET